MAYAPPPPQLDGRGPPDLLRRDEVSHIFSKSIVAGAKHAIKA